jgi:DNA polymerase III alpha subunit
VVKVLSLSQDVMSGLRTKQIAKSRHVLLILVKDRTGYLQLCELLTSAWLTNQHRGRAEIRFEWLEQTAPPVKTDI